MAKFASQAPAGARMVVGHSGLEPETSVLSGLRSNQLSYTPMRQVYIVAYFYCQKSATPYVPFANLVLVF